LWGWPKQKVYWPKPIIPFMNWNKKNPNALASAPLDSLRIKYSVCVFQFVKFAQKAWA
jgi:hypothetical protein